jgi:hypothetical protein
MQSREECALLLHIRTEGRKEEHTQLKKGRTHTHKRKYNAIIVERRRKKENEFQTFVIPSV